MIAGDDNALRCMNGEFSLYVDCLSVDKTDKCETSSVESTVMSSFSEYGLLIAGATVEAMLPLEGRAHGVTQYTTKTLNGSRTSLIAVAVGSSVQLYDGALRLRHMYTLPSRPPLPGASKKEVEVWTAYRGGRLSASGLADRLSQLAGSNGDAGASIALSGASLDVLALKDVSSYGS